MKRLILILGYIVLGNTLIYAQHLNEDHNPEAHNHFSKHHIALFIGATTNFSHESTSYTIGLDYEYRFSKFLGLGLFGEYIVSEPEEILAGLAVYAHPFKGAKLLAAPLLVFSEGLHDTEHEPGKAANFAFRIAAGYDFHIGNLSIGPVVNFDIGATKAISYGLSIGFGF